MSQPTIRQMATRANDGHRKALSSLAEGHPYVHPSEPASSLRGMRTCLTTLRRWGCIETQEVGVGRYEDHLTDAGRALLEALTADPSRKD